MTDENTTNIWVCKTCGRQVKVETYDGDCLECVARKRRPQAPNTFAEHLKRCLEQSAKANGYIIQNIPLHVYGGAIALMDNRGASDA